MYNLEVLVFMDGGKPGKPDKYPGVQESSLMESAITTAPLLLPQKLLQWTEWLTPINVIHQEHA